MSIVNLVETIEKVRETKSRAEKEKLIRGIKETPDWSTFLTACEQMFCPKVVYGMSSPDVNPTEYAEDVDGDDTSIATSVFQVLKARAAKRLTRTKAKEALLPLYKAAGPVRVRFFGMVVEKTFGKGVPSTMVRRALPEITVPTFAWVRSDEPAEE